MQEKYNKINRVKLGAIVGGSIGLVGGIIILYLIAQELGVPNDKAEWFSAIFEVSLFSIVGSVIGAFLGYSRRIKKRHIVTSKNKFDISDSKYKK